MTDMLTMINKGKTIYDIKNMFKGMQTPLAKKLSVIIINLPCNGFGDIVFAMKFSNILKEWYGCSVKIVTSQKNGFISLGEHPDNIFELQSENGKNTNLQCRRLSKLLISENYIADIIFVAPLNADYTPNIQDVKNMFPYANKLNTFFLSEYNDSIRKKIDFHTGIGHNRYGLLFTDIKESTPLTELNYQYAVVYIQPHIGNYTGCLYNFIKLVCLKYNNNNFEIVLPNWITKPILNNICKILSIYFKTIVICTKEDKTKLQGNQSSNYKVYIRLDIFPLTNKKMIDLMMYSVKDILVTGDQSITDVLSCCVDKNIYYQIAPWKENFATNLVKEMPHKWLASKKTSCGGEKTINYKSNYKKFKNRWDFRKLAKPEIDSIFYFTAKSKYGDKNLSIYRDLVLSSKTKKSLSNKIKNIYK